MKTLQVLSLFHSNSDFVTNPKELENRLVELVNLWARHAAKSPDLSIEEFCAQVLAERSAAHAAHPDDPEQSPQFVPHGYNFLSMLVGKLSKYTNLYCKKAFAGLAITNVEDVVYLSVLQQMGQPRKTDLITRMVSEFPSGIDVIKRLSQAGFVEEFPDESDRRSKRLRITEAGREFLTVALPQLNLVSEMAFSTLTMDEQLLLSNILGRLDKFHEQRLKEVRQSDFVQAHALLVQKQEGH